jgi:mannosyltransferase OCH1-like enzyme
MAIYSINHWSITFDLNLFVFNMISLYKKKIYPIDRELIEYNKLMRPCLLNSTHNIPLHLYTCWHTKSLPPLMQQNYNKLLKENPDIQFHLYDENECRVFIEQHFPPEVVQAYDNLIPCSYKSDLWRFCVLYVYGGIYIDIKYTTMNGFKFSGLTDKPYFVRDACKTDVYTALIIAMPQDCALLACIYQIVQNVQNKFYGHSPLSPTGPSLLGNYFTQDVKNNLVLYHAFKPTIHKYYIAYKDAIILQFYDGYREEQRMYQKNKGYVILWNEKNIYR